MHAAYIIPAANLPRFAEQVERLNARARRIGVPETMIATAHAYYIVEFSNTAGGKYYLADRDTHFDNDGRRVLGGAVDVDTEAPRRFFQHVTRTGRLEEYLTLTVTGEAPKYDGWEFLGTLSPIPTDKGLENEVRATPGNTIPADYRHRVGTCDHCNTHRKRNDTYVVRNDDGRTRMVGKNCLRDFLGHQDPHKLAQWAELLTSLDALATDAESEDWEEMGGGGYTESVYSLDEFLAVVSSMCRVDGWLSRTAAYDQGRDGCATADDAIRYYHPPRVGQALDDWRKWANERRPNDDDKARAAGAIQWALDLGDDSADDYIYNCNLIARSGIVRHKSAGVAASIIAAYDREIERRRRAERPDSQHVGEIGKRQEMTLTLHKVIACGGGMYGPTYLHIMTDEAGNDVKWFASSEADWLEVGATIRVNATPKAHDEYRGRPQTVVTRVTKAKEKAPKKPRKAKTAAV